MTRLLTLIAAIFLTSCSPKDETQNDASQDDDMNFVSDVGFEDSGSDSTFPTFLNFLDTKASSIPVTYYPLLKLDTTGYNENAFGIEMQKDEGNQKIFVIGKELGCSAILCGREIKVYRLGKDRIWRASEALEFSFQSKPTYSFEHDMFLLITDNVKDFEENDTGAMNAKSEPYNVDYVIVDFENRISGIDNHAAGELRIMRSYIFARYGYKFTSADLSEYFKKFEWYKPLYDNVDEKLTATDKKIINAILALEKK